MARREAHSRFQRGSGCYTCRLCGKQTRDTGHDEASCQLCRRCYEFASWENTHSDEHDGDNTDPHCPLCKGITLEEFQP